MFDIKMMLFACLLLPRIYMLDWSSTPTELQEQYLTSSTELIIPVNPDLVLVGDLTDGY